MARLVASKKKTFATDMMKQARLELGLSQQNMVELLKVQASISIGRPFYERIENRRTGLLKVQYMAAIARILNKQIDELFELEGES